MNALPAETNLTHDPRSHPDADRVLTHAVRESRDLLQVSGKELAAILGVDPATVSRWGKSVARGKSGGDTVTIKATSKVGELALLYLRMTRGLLALFGNDQASAREWLHGPHEYFQAKPIDLIQTPQGLVHVCDYLDAVRGH